jgi:hypothetical protein
MGGSGWVAVAGWQWMGGSGSVAVWQCGGSVAEWQGGSGSVAVCGSVAVQQ